MVDVSVLLKLPGSGPAFRSLASQVRDDAATRHKVAKLSIDSDSASSSRNRNATGVGRVAAGPARVQVIGLDPPQPSSSTDFLVRQAKASIRSLLDGDSNDKSPLSHERLYNVIRHITVNSSRAEDILDHLNVELEKAVTRIYERLKVVEANSILFQRLASELDRFERQVKDVSGALAFLDRLYVVEVQPGNSIQRIANAKLSRGLFEKIEFKKALQISISDWLQSEHEKGTPHAIREYIPRVIRHLQIHQLYGALFERSYLTVTREYYATRFSKFTDSYSFLLYCVQKVQEEVDRAEAVLPESSRGAARHAVEAGLLDGHADWLAKGVTGKLLDEKNINELSMLHDLLTRAAAEPALVDAFKSAVQERVGTIVKDVDRSEEMVVRLLELKSVCDAAVENAFQGPHRNYTYALADGFTAGFLTRRRAPAEMLAKYVDRLMRKGHQGASDEEFGKKLDAVLALYRFTDDKDVFRAFYHRALSRRLLLGRSASDDFEKAVLTKLKEQYDPEFGMGDQMFSDLILSREMMREYHQRLPETSQAHKLNVMVLQQSVWPFSSRQQGDLHLPFSMQKDLAGFEKFYQEKHKGRKLEWNHALGTVTLIARFPTATKDQDKIKDLSVSLYQAAVLLLFEDADASEGKELGYKEILDTVLIPDAELRRTLQSLACGKKRVLKKIPPGRDVNDDDKFTINESFRDPFHTVHINSIQAKETPEESKRTQQAVEGDRKHLLDAAIVRIMKAKKQLTYEEIKTQTIEAVRRHFAPDVASIKQRIDALVESEYLRRDDEDRNLFYYVA